MSVQIINLRTGQPYDFRCDRQSPVGNPFAMHNEGERDTVCDKYAAYFNQAMNTNKVFKEYMNRIAEHYRQHGTVTLACWCAPKRCHCETIKQWILNPW